MLLLGNPKVRTPGSAMPPQWSLGLIMGNRTLPSSNQPPLQRSSCWNLQDEYIWPVFARPAPSSLQARSASAKFSCPSMKNTEPGKAKVRYCLNFYAFTLILYLVGPHFTFDSTGWTILWLFHMVISASDQQFFKYSHQPILYHKLCHVQIHVNSRFFYSLMLCLKFGRLSCWPLHA